jgi:hypothetical protein
MVDTVLPTVQKVYPPDAVVASHAIARQGQYHIKRKYANEHIQNFTGKCRDLIIPSNLKRNCEGTNALEVPFVTIRSPTAIPSHSFSEWNDSCVCKLRASRWSARP